MGIVLSAFIKATCLSSLLWFVLPLMSLLRLRLIQLSSMELMDTHTAMVPMAMLPHTPMPPQLLLLDTESPMLPTPYELLDSPPLLSQLLLVDMPLLADMLPTLPELSMLPRDPPMLRLMLMLTMDTHMLMDMDTHTDTEPTDMDTHTELTTERDLLMLSQRPRLMLLSCTGLTDMVLTHMPHMLMVPTHIPTVTHMLTMERDLLMPSQRLMLMLTTDTHMLMDMVLTHTDTEPMDTDTDTHMPTESTESKLFLSRKY